MARPRPLSPHLGIWRFQLPALMSISHRATGVILSTGTVLLTVWLLALASGPEAFGLAQMVITHPLGQLVMFGYSVVLFYHGCNGIRHLNWDLGRGLDIPDVYRSGQMVLLAAVVLTALFWLGLYLL